MTDNFMRLGEVAKQTGVSRTTVYRWIINGQLKAYRLPGGHYRVSAEDLTAFGKTFNIPVIN